MTQVRPRVRIEKKQYLDRNIWDMSIDITYFVLDILQVVIFRSTYYISFERMCLTASGLSIFGKRYDVHNNVAYMTTKLSRFYARNEISK